MNKLMCPNGTFTSMKIRGFKTANKIGVNEKETRIKKKETKKKEKQEYMDIVILPLSEMNAATNTRQTRAETEQLLS